MPTPKHDLPVEVFNVDELTTYHQNPRRGDVDAIAESLEVNGQYRPIVVNLGSKTGRPLEVLCGNHTLAAARRLGWQTVEASVIDVDNLAAARIVVADNRTGELGEYDHVDLVGLLSALGDLRGTGYSLDYLEPEVEREAPSREPKVTDQALVLDQIRIPLDDDEFTRLCAAIKVWLQETGTLHGFAGHHLVEPNIARLEEVLRGCNA